MVEQRTKELDELNKQAVQQVPNLPKDGVVDLKARAKYKEGKVEFDIYHQKVYDEEEKIAELDNVSSHDNGNVKEGTVNINNKKDTSKEGEKLENDPEDD